MIRVLVADDSKTSRALLAEILRTDPTIEVVGEARDGVEVVEMTVALRPDVVTMDVHMPRMDGFEATRQIMAQAPTPIVIVTVSANARTVETSMNALEAGALSVLAKPVGPTDPDFLEAARRFTSTVKAMSQVKVVRRWHRPTTRPPTARVAAAQVVVPGARVGLVAIAASTGGPSALHRLLAELPATFPVPILVVQHISRGFVEGFASWLDGLCVLRVKVAVEGEALVPGTVYVAPDDRHLGVADRSRVRLSGEAPVGGFRPSATPLFESVAREFGAGMVAVVLTGMGQDGVDGLHPVRAAGGRVLVQDEETSVVYGMARVAVEAGLVDAVLPLGSIAARIVAMTSG